MKLRIIESPANPTRLWVVNADTPTVRFEGTDCCYEYQLTRPLKLVGHDPDSLFVASLKSFTGKIGGFSSWQEADVYLSNIEDVEAAAISVGTTIQTILEIPE